MKMKIIKMKKRNDQKVSTKLAPSVKIIKIVVKKEIMIRRKI